MVKILIGNVYSKIVGYLPDQVHKDLYDTLAYYIQGARFIPRVKDNKWDGYIRFYYQNKGQSFLTGLMTFVREILTRNNIQYEIADQRVIPPKNYPELAFKPPPNYEERAYQNFTVERAIKFTRGILSICTAGGKTVLVSKLIAQLQTYPFIFFVTTKDLLEQAHDVLSTYLNVSIGKIGDGIADIQKISVCTVQTAIRAINIQNNKFKIDDYMFDDEDNWDEKNIESLEKAEKIKKLISVCNGFYADEIQHIASKTIKEVILNTPNAYWRYGGSATPYREDNADIVIQALLGAKIVDIKASNLIKHGYLVKPYIFIEPIESDVHYHSYAKIYQKSIVQNKEFNNHVAETVKYLTDKKLSVLVLVQQYEHGNYLKTVIPNSEFITGKVSSGKRLQYIQDLREGKITLIGTTLVDEGVDISGLDAVIIAGGGKSVSRINQRIGRCLRKNKSASKQKNKAIVIIYQHSAKYLFNHVKKIRSILKKEPEFVVINSNGTNSIFKEIDAVLCDKDIGSDPVFDLKQ